MLFALRIVVAQPTEVSCETELGDYRNCFCCKMSKKGWEAALESGLKMSGETGAQKELGWLMIAKWVCLFIQKEKTSAAYEAQGSLWCT